MDHTIVHFEIPVDDVNRASTFYREVFGWEISRMPGPFDYFGVRTTASGENGMPTGPGVNGGMMKRMSPEQRLTNYIGVEDVDAHAARLIKAGGTITEPKMAVPGVGWFVQFHDPEGNLLALWQSDKNAA